jgi:hypothetical protein
MKRYAKWIALVMTAAGVVLFHQSREARAQGVVTTYYPAPVVQYVPVRRGLLGLRTGYAPVVTYPATAVTSTYYAPAAPVTTYYAPAAPVTTYYAPSAPVTTYYAPSAPVTTYYAPAAPVTTYYPPMVIVD